MYIILEILKILNKKNDKNGNGVLNVKVIANFEYLESKKNYYELEKDFFELYISKKLKNGTYNVKAYKSVFIKNFYKFLLINIKFDKLFIKDKIDNFEYQFIKNYTSNIELIKDLFTKEEIKSMQNNLNKRIKTIDSCDYSKLDRSFVQYMSRILMNLPYNDNFNGLVSKILSIK